MLARARFLAGSAGLVVSFAVPRAALGQVVGNPSAGVDAWLAIDRSGTILVRFGKVELGTGIATAVAQIVADELDAPFAQIRVAEADTNDTPDQGYTAGSASLSSGAVPVRQAAAEARLAVLALAAAHFGVTTDRLQTANGVVAVRGESRRATYGELVDGQALHRTISAATKVKDPDAYRVVGQPIPRVDVPDKVYGSYAYMQNLRVPGMLHGRVIRPTPIGATLASVDETSIAGMHGVRVVKRDAFLGVVAPTEWAAITAMRKLKVTWTGGGLAPVNDLAAAVRAVPQLSEKAIVDTGNVAALGSSALNATYVWPYQTHGSIGPSCGVADVRDGKATIWSSTQGIFPLRPAIATLLGLPQSAVLVKYVEGSGCYGHNGSDDAAADAALLSQAVGAPVRVQWMRDQEHGWDPKGPAMVMAHSAALDSAGTHIATWRSDVWSPSHSTRPGGDVGNLLDGRLTNAPAAKVVFTGGDRDAKVNYQIPNYRVTMHNLSDGILHSSAMRGLGGTQNTFANESFMDELAAAAHADPLGFRRAHLTNDQRALDLLTALARLGTWQARPAAANVDRSAATVRGRGLSFVRYENTEAYVGCIADVVVNRKTGQVRVERLAIAHDCGLIVNPDGLRNQIEGNAIQAMSRTLKERVAFNTSGVTSLDWHSYPIVRFSDVPEVTIALIDRTHEPVLGAGEATTTVIAPALGNAIYDATGVRLREVPFTPDRVAAALRSA
ncbi:MAG TPA: molybdopterin cofactor-binding domain-containing protein [Candidatus Lustribacter sp.]|jgi:CO/xanthine dehydrogenase Mo-binding subunit|nr:molybdopterin cofactor-binding domain-containing protein [Candidatus Lustribacter sp.]